MEEGEKPYVRLQLYKAGRLIDEDFAIPGKAGKPKVIAKGPTWFVGQKQNKWARYIIKIATSTILSI